MGSTPVALTPEQLTAKSAEMDTNLETQIQSFRSIADTLTNLGSSGFVGQAGTAMVAKGEQLRQDADKLAKIGLEKSATLKEFGNQNVSLQEEKAAAINSVA